MTDEDILKLAKTCGFDYFTGTTEEDSSPYWECWEDQLLRFAQIIHKNGYCDGSVEGHRSGSTGDFGEPLG